jgi:MFS transporter, DHA1 family, multidrug resistance protein
MGICPLEYSLFFAMTSVGYVLGNFINGFLVGQVGVVRMTYFGSLLTVLVPVLMLAGGITGLLTPLLISFLCFVLTSATGLPLRMR